MSKRLIKSIMYDSSLYVRWKRGIDLGEVTLEVKEEEHRVEEICQLKKSLLPLQQKIRLFYHLHRVEECAICWQPKETLNFLKCGHSFHPECLKNWTQPTCPSCRTQDWGPARTMIPFLVTYQGNHCIPTGFDLLRRIEVDRPGKYRLILARHPDRVLATFEQVWSPHFPLIIGGAKQEEFQVLGAEGKVTYYLTLLDSSEQQKLSQTRLFILENRFYFTTGDFFLLKEWIYPPNTI